MLQKHRNLGDEKIVQNKLCIVEFPKQTPNSIVYPNGASDEKEEIFDDKKNWINIDVIIHMLRERKNSSAQICIWVICVHKLNF